MADSLLLSNMNFVCNSLITTLKNQFIIKEIIFLTIGPKYWAFYSLIFVMDIPVMITENWNDSVYENR